MVLLTHHPSFSGRLQNEGVTEGPVTPLVKVKLLMESEPAARMC